MCNKSDILYLQLTLDIELKVRVVNGETRNYRNWAEINIDSASDYGFGETDEDSTPDCLFQGRLSQ